MALAVGTYVIVSALNTGYALDVANGSNDENGRRVQLFKRNDTDAQIVRVVKSGSLYQVIFILSGMALDRDQNGSANGTVVHQWDAYQTPNQLWDIAEDGENVQVGGSSLPTYLLRHESVQTSVLDVNGAVVADGTSVTMYAANGTDSQRWAFVPLDPIPDGTWVIHSALSDDLVLDVVGNSQASGANVQIYSQNGTNAQAWKTSTADGISLVLNSQSSKALDVQYNSPANGTNVQIYAQNGTEAQNWVIEQSGRTATVNGSTVPMYVVHAVSGMGRVLDVAGGGREPETNVQVYDANGTDAQLFWFEPTEYTADGLPVPSSGGLSMEVKGGISQSPVLANGSGTVYPAWVCDGEQYQVRYRVAERKSSMENVDKGQFTDWMDMYSDSTGNGGWGRIQTANVQPVRDGNRNWSERGIGFDISTDDTDLVTIEFSVRRFAESFGATGSAAHGNQATFTNKVCWDASVDIDMVFAPDGLRVLYESDFPRGGNSLYVSCDGLFDRHGFSGLGPSGYVTIPIDDLERIPDDGETVSVSYRWSTYDSSMGDREAEVQVSMSADHGTTVTASADVEGVNAVITGQKGASVWLLIPRGHRDRFVPIELDSENKANVAPPLGVRWRIFTSIDNGDTWATRMYEFDPIETIGWHLSSLSMDDDFELFVTDSIGGADVNMGYERDSSVTKTTGRERDVVGTGSTVSATWGLNGVLIGDDLESSTELFDEFAHKRYVVFRDRWGFWAQAAVVSSSINRSLKSSRAVSFSFREVEL